MYEWCLSMKEASKNSKLCVCVLDDLPKRRCPLLYKPSDPDSLAYLDFSVSTTGMLAGVKVQFFILLIQGFSNFMMPRIPK